jgi:hypothetical protein
MMIEGLDGDNDSSRVSIKKSIGCGDDVFEMELQCSTKILLYLNIFEYVMYFYRGRVKNGLKN